MPFLSGFHLSKIIFNVFIIAFALCSVYAYGSGTIRKISNGNNDANIFIYIYTSDGSENSKRYLLPSGSNGKNEMLSILLIAQATQQWVNFHLTGSSYVEGSLTTYYIDAVALAATQALDW